MFEGKKSVDDLNEKEFEEYSNAVAKGEIEPFPEGDEEIPGPKDDKTKEPDKTETEEEKKEREDAEAQAKADADAAAEAEAKAKAKSEGKVDDKDKKPDAGANPAPSMPLSKYKHQKEKWAATTAATIAEMETKHKQEIEDLKKSIADPDATKKSVETDIEKFAKDNHIEDPNVIKGLVEVIKKNLPGLDPETKKALTEFQESKKNASEEALFELDFSKSAEPILKKLNPNLDDAHLKEAKTVLKKLAYDDKYLKLSLEEIISLKQKSFIYNLEKKKTVESSRPGSQAATKVNDYYSWTDEDIEAASPEEFEKYSEHMASKSPSRFKVTDKDGKEVK